MTEKLFFDKTEEAIWDSLLDKKEVTIKKSFKETR